MRITVYPGTPIPTRLPLWRRWAFDIAEAWRASRQAALQRQRLRALEGLSDATLRDIGVADLMPPRRCTLAMTDFLRGL